MGAGLYILDDAGTPEPCEDALTWAEWMETHDRQVCQDMDEGAGADRVRVSTIFLGIDHHFFGDGPPILWETMVFGGPLDGTIDRYQSLIEAGVGHQAMCRRVMAAR